MSAVYKLEAEFSIPSTLYKGEFTFWGSGIAERFTAIEPSVLLKAIKDPACGREVHDAFVGAVVAWSLADFPPVAGAEIGVGFQNA